MASAERGGRRVIAVMMGGTTGKSRDAHVADLLEAAFLEISGTVADDDLRTRIAFGSRGNVSADELALAQLRKLQEPDAALVNAGFAEIESTEEYDALLEEVAEGDGESITDEGDPIGDLLEAMPGALDVSNQPVAQ
jgi:D-alanyl-D-alanine carboxypeptidase